MKSSVKEEKKKGNLNSILISQIFFSKGFLYGGPTVVKLTHILARVKLGVAALLTIISIYMALELTRKTGLRMACRLGCKV